MFQWIKKVALGVWRKTHYIVLAVMLVSLVTLGVISASEKLTAVYYNSQIAPFVYADTSQKLSK